MYVKIMFPMAYINVCMAYMLHIPTSSIKALIMMSVILKSTGNQKIKANVNSINRWYMPQSQLVRNINEIKKTSHN